MNKLDGADAAYALVAREVGLDSSCEVLHVDADVNEHIKYRKLAVIDRNEAAVSVVHK